MKRLRQIKSDHFTDQETVEYKINLIRPTEAKVVSMGMIMPSREFRNTYYCFVDTKHKPIPKGVGFFIPEISTFAKRIPAFVHNFRLDLRPKI